jgi:hypothetical protein
MSSLDGQAFPKEPLDVIWRKNKIGTRGDGRPLFSGYQPLELVLPILTYTEYNYFYDRWEADQFYTMVMTSPDSQTSTTYTGVIIESVEGNEFDVPLYFRNVRVTMIVPR